MISSIVMTLIGTDRPGLVQLVAACVADHGGNWLESRMCHLGGRFAGIVRVEVAAEKAAALEQSLYRLKGEGLQVLVDLAGAAAPAGGGCNAVLELVGQDRPGLVRTVSSVLAAHGVNVEELSSECVSAPMGGGNLFQAKARVFVPATVRIEAVRADLEKIAADLMVDVTLQPGTG